MSVLIVGAGPVGSTLACVLKATNPALDVTVIDKREVATRKYGLSLGADAINKVIKVLGNSDESLSQVISRWKDQIVRTNEIEERMAVEAARLGVKIQRGEKHAFKKDDLESLCKRGSIIIAADGAHSTLRSALIIKKVQEQTFQHMVELKYETDGTQRQRGYIDATLESSKTGHLGFEIVSGRKVDGKKPLTYLLMSDREAYKALRSKAKLTLEEANLLLSDMEAGRPLRRKKKTTWTLKELASHQNPSVQKVYKALQHYLQGKSISGEEISPLKLKIFRNEKSVAVVYDTPFAFVGDSNSGLPFQRGMTKALEEISLLVPKITAALAARSHEPLFDYEKESHALFERERRVIIIKDKALGMAQKSVKKTAHSSYKVQANYAWFCQKVDGIASFVKRLIGF